MKLLAFTAKKLHYRAEKRLARSYSFAFASASAGMTCSKIERRVPIVIAVLRDGYSLNILRNIEENNQGILFPSNVMAEAGKYR